MNLYSHFYYFLIWGHGLKYTDNIIQMIENVKELAIRKIVYHNPKSMSRFIKQVYSYDYAPLSHLKGKTRYLKKTPRRVLFIFVENYEPNEVMYGEGEYLHRESTTIKALKESIRDKYNDRKDDRRSEDHVVHASDNEEQTDYMLKYLGYATGVDALKKNGMFGLPYHIGHYTHFKLKYMNVEDLYINMIIGKGSTKLVSIFESPHYRGIMEDIMIYKNYINKYRGTFLQDYYSVDKFKSIFDKFDYQKYMEDASYVTVKKSENVYVILDGAHRASIMLAKGIKDIVVIEV